MATETLNKRSNHCSTGEVDGTGSAISINCGFKPLFLQVFNVDGNCFASHCFFEADAAMQKTVDSGAGTCDVSYVTSDGITLTANGFSIGADTDLNVSGEELQWVAFK